MKRIGIILVVLFPVLLGAATSHAVLYFPHVATEPPWQTEICVINPGETATIQGTLKSYSFPDGSLRHSRALSVGPSDRVQLDVGSELTNAANNGYIVFENTSGWPLGYTKFSQTGTGGDRVAIPASDNVNTGTVYITHIAWAPWWTGIALVNTTAQTKNLTIRFNTGATRTITLPPMQKYVNTVEGLLGGVYQNIVSAEIDGADGIVGLELFAIGMGGVIGGVPLISGTAATLYYPHLVSSAEWWTGLVAYNPANTAAQITVNSYNDQGALQSSTASSIPARTKFVGNPNNLNLPSTATWFSLHSQKPLVGFELFGTFDGKRLAGYSSVDIEGRTGLFPKLEKDGWTGIAFVNTENRQVTVINKAHDNAGTVLATAQKILKAHEKWVGVAESLFPGVNLSMANYLSFSADGNVAGFQLNNNTTDTMLDALPNAAPSGFKVVDKALAFFRYESALSVGMESLTDIFEQITASEGGTCPQTSMSPATLDLDNLPPTITITADYGNGCRATDGSTMSGKAVLAVSNVVSTDTSLALDFSLTATNLKRDGAVVLNGSASGNIAMTLNDSAITRATASLTFNNFLVADTTLSGGLSITANNITTGDTYTYGDITIAFNNQTTAGYTVYSGTLKLTSTGATSSRMVVDLETSQGPVDMTLNVQSPSDTRTIINTAFNGTIAGYTIILKNVVIDTTVCSGYPSAGSATVSQGGSTVTIDFTPADCPASERMEQRSQAFSPEPMHCLEPWRPFTGWVSPLLGLFK